MRTVEQRITSLERSRRLWRLATLLPLAALLFMATDEPSAPESIEAQAFVMVDAEDEELGRFDTYEGNGRLLLSAKGENWTAALGASEAQGGSLVLHAPDGQTGVLLVARAKQIGRGVIFANDNLGNNIWSTPHE